jgi:hypothetical protein
MKLFDGVYPISLDEALAFILPRHYAGRTPCVSKAFGWIHKGALVAVATFGKPASPSLCVGLLGEAHAPCVYELNRLCREEGLLLPLSSFVGACLRQLKKENWVVVSYADTAMSHHGFIYQACNFLYTGVTKERTDKYTEGNKHSRHYNNDTQGLRKVRSAKHRYVYFCTKDKALKKQWGESLLYPVLPYPKGDNLNYTLGQVLAPVVIHT